MNAPHLPWRCGDRFRLDRAVSSARKVNRGRSPRYLASVRRRGAQAMAPRNRRSTSKPTANLPQKNTLRRRVGGHVCYRSGSPVLRRSIFRIQNAPPCGRRGWTSHAGASRPTRKYAVAPAAGQWGRHDAYGPRAGIRGAACPPPPRPRRPAPAPYRRAAPPDPARPAHRAPCSTTTAPFAGTMPRRAELAGERTGRAAGRGVLEVARAGIEEARGGRRGRVDRVQAEQVAAERPPRGAAR